MSFDDPLYILLHLGSFAFFISLAFSGFMVFAGVMDTADARSAHKNSVPTGGGIGIVAGLGASLLALSMFYPIFDNLAILGALSALAFSVAFLGLLDDIVVVDSKIKFLIIILITIACVFEIGAPRALPLASVMIPLPLWIGFIGAVLWLFVVVNGVNFMDGSNGLMSGFMCAAFFAMAGISLLMSAPLATILATIMAGALLGFMPYNFKNKANIFCGDVGSLLTGLMFGICSLLLAAKNADLLYVGPFLLLPFLADVFLTMLRRARYKENLLTPHSTHLYQRLIKAGYSHVTVAVGYTMSAILMGVIALIGVNYGLIKSIFFLGIWVCALTLIYLLIDKKLHSIVPN